MREEVALKINLPESRVQVSSLFFLINIFLIGFYDLFSRMMALLEVEGLLLISLTFAFFWISTCLFFFSIFWLLLRVMGQEVD